MSIQIIVTAKGGSFTNCAFKLQMSNTGGSAAGVWVDVPSATLTMSDVGSGFLGVSNEGLRTAKLYRVVATAAGDSCTFYAIAFGLNK
jgi:hypothetical protein